jgi:thioredoxin-dependent peroxiredoxin
LLTLNQIFRFISKYILISLILLSNLFALQIGDQAPNFTTQSTKGEINFYDWVGENWVIIFSHPAAFTPVCTTELATLAKLQPEFKKRKVKVMTLSADSVKDNLEWIPLINKYKEKLMLKSSLGEKITNFGENNDVNFPILVDDNLKISTIYGMYHPKAEPNGGVFGTKRKETIRSVFIIDPKKNIQTILIYPKNIGRNFNEILRIVDALKISKKYKVSTPANWENGSDVIVPSSMVDEAIEENYGTLTNTRDFELFRTIKQPGKIDEIKGRNPSGPKKW